MWGILLCILIRKNTDNVIKAKASMTLSVLSDNHRILFSETLGDGCISAAAAQRLHCSVAGETLVDGL